MPAMRFSGNVVSLLRHAPFRHQFLASATSMIGSAITPVALAVGVLQLTGSAAQLGVVLAAYSVPQVVFLVAGGVWADRIPRQRVMLLADGLRFVSQTAFGVLLVLEHDSLAVMIVLQAVAGVGSALFLPASVGLVADTAPPGQRQEANALLSLTRNITGTLGPIVAGGIVVLLGAGWALILDGATFALSMMFLALLRLPAREKDPEADQTGFLADLVAGWREVIRRTWVWTTIAYSMVFNVCFAALLVLGPATLVHGDSGAFAWGLTAAGLGFGQVVGNLLALAWRPARPLLTGRLIMFTAAPVLLLLAADAPVVLVVVGSVLCGFAMSFPDTLWDMALQEHIDEASLARVSSFDFLGSFLLMPLGLALAALLADLLGTGRTLALAGVVMVAATAVSLLDSSMRTLARQPGADAEVAR